VRPPEFGGGEKEWPAISIAEYGSRIQAALERMNEANSGHLIHLDEWLSSPFQAGSTCRFRSGMAIQMDIIPVSEGPFCYSNAEDGIALADEALRTDIANRHRACWQRLQARRSFMAGTLGITLDASLLPLGNTPGWLCPYALSPGLAFVKDG
jgi:hypothetical protein